MNGAELDPSIWIYAVHSDNPELIHFLEEKKNVLDETLFEKVYIESIKCHNNDVANYIKNNYLNDNKNVEKTSIRKALKYFNFAFVCENIEKESFLPHLCKYDYYPIVENMMKTQSIDINCLIKSQLKDDGIFHALKELKEEKNRFTYCY